MSTYAVILIGLLVLSGLAVFIRGVVGTTRTYTQTDAIFGVIEIAFMIWLVLKVAA